MATGVPDRPPPHSQESEVGCLGCILLDPACLNVCIDKFKANSQVFYDLRCRAVFEAMVRLHDQKIPIDTITLTTELKNSNLLEQCGGTAFISSLPDQVPTAANLDYYVDIVFQKFLLRSYLKVCSAATSRIYDCEGDVEELIGDVEKSIIEVGNQRYRKQFEGTKSLVQKALQDFDRSISQQGALTGIASGMADLDKLTWGFQAGDYIIIAARPGCGKTSVTLNWVEHIVLDLNMPAGVFSLEMTALALVKRMISSRSQVNLRNILSGRIDPAEVSRMTEAAGLIQNAPLYIEDESKNTLPEIRSKATRMVQDWGAKLLVIDYLQLMHLGTKIGKNRQEEIAEISMGLKSMAKDLKVPVIGISQLNRSSEDKSRKPNLSDLRSSGALEQDADVVGLLYNPKEKDNDEEDTADSSGFNREDKAVPVVLNLAKQRNGPTGIVPLIFLKAYTKFVCAPKVEQKDMPMDTPANVVPYKED